MRKTDFISIPKGLSTQVVKNNVDHKSIAIFYCLKSIYVGGVIKNYRKRYSFLCDELGICEKTLRTYLRILKEKGLVYHKDSHLFLTSSRKVAQKYSVSKYRFKVKIDDSIDYRKIQAIFIALAMKENFSQQEYVLRKKITKEFINKKSNFHKGKIYPKMIKSYKERVKDHFDIFLKEEKKRFHKYVIDSVKNNKKIKLKNPDITLSRLGIAKLRNCRSSYTGFNTLNKLKKYSLIEKDSFNNIIVSSMNSNYYELILNNRNLFCFKGSIYYKGINSIKINETVLINPL